MDLAKIRERLILENNDLVNDLSIYFANIPEETLIWKPKKNSWSICQVFEHLNIAARHYHRHLQNAIFEAEKNPVKNQTTYQPGFWGSILTSTLKPGKRGKIRFKMKTFKKADPRQQPAPNIHAIDEFGRHLQEFDTILQQCQVVDWTGKRIPSWVGDRYRFRFGDCLRFLVAHNQRHVIQAYNILESFNALNQPATDLTRS